MLPLWLLAVVLVSKKFFKAKRNKGSEEYEAENHTSAFVDRSTEGAQSNDQGSWPWPP
jgi:hypothetical protein